MTLAFGTSMPTSTTVVDDEQMQLARRKRLHHPLLAVGLQPAVQQADAVRGKHFLREVVGHLGGRLEVDLVRLFHERIDDVRLTARVELPADERVDLVAARSRASPRVLIGSRPGGRSRMTDTSRSPYSVSASVRGIGVAVITSTSGRSPLPEASPAAARRTGAARR